MGNQARVLRLRCNPLSKPNESVFQFSCACQIYFPRIFWKIVKLNCKTRNTWQLFAGESVVSDWPSFRAQIRDSCFSNAFLHAQPPGQPDRTQFLSFLPKTTPPRHFPPSIHSVKFVSKISQWVLWHLVHILIDWKLK